MRKASKKQAHQQQGQCQDRAAHKRQAEHAKREGRKRERESEKERQREIGDRVAVDLKILVSKRKPRHRCERQLKQARPKNLSEKEALTRPALGQAFPPEVNSRSC